MGTSDIASAPGQVSGMKRESLLSCGVLPPCENQVVPSTMVRPDTRMLMAMPDTMWLPAWVMQA